MTARSRHAFELAGWLTFVASACFFLAATIRSGDLLSIAGSGLFLAACFVFMVPLLKRPAGPVGTLQPAEEKICRNQAG
ncbi:MAG: hypothetical protein OER56_10180 [Hyphomicrobiales bacterium]|nr:hypothetical protein [Hyphomicrobiales bacterium]